MATQWRQSDPGRLSALCHSATWLFFLAMFPVTVAHAQAPAQAQPVPPPGKPPTYQSFNVDTSTKIHLRYTAGAKGVGDRLLLTSGELPKDSTLTMNATSSLGMPSAATVEIELYYSELERKDPTKVTVKGLTWQADKGQYSATGDKMPDLAAGLVASINAVTGGVTAQGQDPRIVATAKISLQYANVGDKAPSSPVDGYIQIVLERMTPPPPVAAPPEVGTAAPEDIAGQQTAAAIDQKAIAGQLASIAIDQLEITRQQQHTEFEQHGIAQQQDAAVKAGKPQDEPAIKMQQDRTAKELEVATKQVQVTVNQVADTVKQVAVLQDQVKKAQAQLAAVQKQIAAAPAAQQSRLREQGTTVQHQVDVAMLLSDVAMARNALAQALSVVAQHQAARAISLSRSAK